MHFSSQEIASSEEINPARDAKQKGHLGLGC